MLENSKDQGEDDGGISYDLDDGRKEFEDPHVRKYQPADASVTGAEEHVAIRPERIDETFVPARALPGKRLQIGGHFSPAGGIGNKVDAIRAVILMQPAVHADDEIKIFSDGVSAKTLRLA